MRPIFAVQGRASFAIAAASLAFALGMATAAKADGIEAHTSSGVVTVSSSGVITVNSGDVGIFAGGANPIVTANGPCQDITVLSGSTETDWSSATTGDWFTSGNWTSGVPTGATDLTSISNGATADINGAEATTGSFFNLCNGTADVQTGGSLTANGILIGSEGTLLLSGSVSVSGDLGLDGGTLRSTINGTLSNNLSFGTTQASTIAAAAGTTLGLTGTFQSFSDGQDIVFGSAMDTGTIILSPSAFTPAGNTAPKGGIEIAGGTLKAGSVALGMLDAASITVGAGATLNLNDEEPTTGNIINNLLGAGNVVTGTVSTTLLTLGAAEFSGSISGAGRLNVNPVCFGTSGVCTTGVVELSGTNTYAGNTTITNGTLIVDTGGAITNSDQIVVNSGGILTVNGMLAGGTISVNSGGVATINGSVTGGATVRSGGTMTVSSTGTVSGSVAVVGGTLDMEGSVSSEFGAIGAQSGGHLTVNGTTSTQYLNIIDAGSTAVINGSSASSAGVVIDQGASLTIGSAGSITTPQEILIDGTFQVDGSATATTDFTIYSTGNLTVEGTAHGGGLTIDDGGVATISGTSTSIGAVTVNSGGALTVNANGSLSTTQNVVIGGTLKVDGSATATSGLAINSGGTLAGTGTVPATQIASGGAVAPGDSGIGTLHVNGTLSIPSGGVYKADVSSSTADKITVTGAATLGGTLTLNTISTPAIGTSYTLLTASGGVTGKFVFPETPVPLGEMEPTLIYDANDVMLEFELSTLAPGLPAAATSNEVNVIGGIDNAIVPGTALPAAFQALGALSPADLGAAASQLSGELAADLPAAAASSVDPFLNVLLDQSGNRGVDFGEGWRGTPGFALRDEMQSNERNGITQLIPTGRLALSGRSTGAVSAWASGFGEHSDMTGDAVGTGAHDVNASTIGGVVGADVLVLRGLVAGAAVADSHSTFSLGGGMGSGASDNLEFGIHATALLGRAAYIAVGGAYALQDVTTSRAITMPSTETLSAKFTAHDLAGRIEAGWHVRLSRIQLTPYLAAQSQSFDTPAYSETSSGASSYALAYESASASNARAELGAALDGEIKFSRNVNLYLYGSGAWAHAFANNQDAHAAFVSLPGSDFVVQGAAAASNLALVSFDAELKGRNGLSFGLKFDGTFSQNSKTYYGTAGFSYAW